MTNARQALPVGRNDRCLCGSGKKFKSCCLPRTEEERKRLFEDMDVPRLNDGFFHFHPFRQLSSAMLLHSSLATPTLEQLAMQIAGRIRPDEAELIRSEPDPLKLLDLLEEGRITNSNHPYLLRKLLPHEAVVIPALLSKLSESDQDALIEQGIRFLNKTTGFPLPQLEELALSASSPYVRSCVCLLLGVRGPETVLPLLWRQFHLLRTAHPEESLSEGPLYGLYELAVRFGRISLKFPEHL